MLERKRSSPSYEKLLELIAAGIAMPELLAVARNEAAGHRIPLAVSLRRLLAIPTGELADQFRGGGRWRCLPFEEA
jgi:hypothetical protein